MKSLLEILYAEGKNKYSLIWENIFPPAHEKQAFEHFSRRQLVPCHGNMSRASGLLPSAGKVN